VYDWVARFPFAAGLRFTAKVGELSRQRNLGSLTERPSQADFVTVMYLSSSGFGELKQLCHNTYRTAVLCIAVRSYLGCLKINIDPAVVITHVCSSPHATSIITWLAYTTHHTHNLSPYPAHHTHNLSPYPAHHTHNLSPYPAHHTHNLGYICFRIIYILCLRRVHPRYSREGRMF